MQKNPFLFWSILIWFIFSTEVTIAQKITDDLGPRHQLEFRHDNDFFLLSDNYYSSGLFLTYRTILKKDLTGSENEQLAFTIGQEVYTPSQTQSTNSANFDRPYAGFTGLHSTWSRAKKNQLFELRLLLGIAGLNSGAGGLQRWFHTIVDITDSPLWVDELPNSFHANLYFSHVREWTISSAPFGIRFAFKPNFALGTRDIYIAPEGIFYFGKRTNLSQSIAYDQLSAVARECYLSFRFSYRQVLYNGLLEGNLVNNNAVFTTPSTNSVFRLGLDFNNRFKRSDYKIGIRYNTRESPLAKAHKYIILAYGFRF